MIRTQKLNLWPNHFTVKKCVRKGEVTQKDTMTSQSKFGKIFQCAHGKAANRNDKNDFTSSNHNSILSFSMNETNNNDKCLMSIAIRFHLTVFINHPY